MSIKGKITSWNDDKGFGFITPCTGGSRTFVHITAFNSRKRPPTINQSVTYSLSTDKQGRLCAVKVARAGERPQKNRKRKDSSAITVASLFLIIVTISALLGKLPFLLLLLYIIVSALSFIIYAVDKSAAMKNTWRIPESTLHILSVAGGWPGAMVAQQTLRHKSKKQPFRVLFWVTVLVNCGVLVWWHTPNGADKLQALIDTII